MMIRVEHFYVGRILFLSLCLCQRGALQNVPPPGVPLGMESGAIPDSSLTASYVHPGLGPERARLHTGSAWYGGGSSTQQWIQVDLSTTYRITGVAIQGRQNINQWVTSFKVACSIDGITFDIVQDALNEPIADKVFVGNTDANTVMYNTLPSVKVCQYVRLLPIRYHSAPMLRIELYGEGPVRGDDEVRLVGGTSDSEGRVEVWYNGEWGTVCDDAWDTNDASVVCRSLGFAGALEAVSSAGFGQGTGTIVLDDVNCFGNESSLFECSNRGLGINNCGHLEDAGVRCPVPEDGELRLVGGISDFEGRVEVWYNGEWGTVCDDAWDTNDASVVCRSLGFAGALEAVSSAVFGPGTGTIVLDDVNCSGNESSVFECSHRGLGVNNCNHYEDAGVRCQVPEVRLVEGPCESEGRVEVYQHGSWGPVCDDNFTVADATIVCQMLGLQVVELLNWDVPPSAVSSINVTLKNPWCGGNETDIRYCMQEPNATCNKYAAVKCSDPLILCVESIDGYSDDSSFLLSSDVETTTRQPLQKISTQTMTTATTLSPIKGALDIILNENITEYNLDVVSVELANVTEDSNKFDVEDLQSVTDKLSSIVEFASNQNLTEETIVKVSVSVIGAVDNILNIPESTFETASSQQVSKTQNILTTISTLTEAIQKASTKNFTYSGSNIVLAAVKVDRKKFPLTTAIGGAMDDVIDFSANEGSPSNAAGVTSVSLPEAILPSDSSTNQVISVSVFLLNSPKLFQGNRPSSSSTPSSGDKQNQQPKAVSVVASPILTVTIEGTDIKDLPDNESIVFVFPVNQTLIREENDAEVSQRCVYWDIDLGEWSDEGCRTEKTALEGMVSCRCSHLTSFAVLLDIKGSIISKALDVISRIGCIASIVCLVITLCILLGFRKLRRKQPQQILINLSFALLALYVTFVIGIDRPTWKISCTVVAILLHYFCLASLAWMGVESFNMYMMFVRVLNSYIPKFLLKCSMIGWGIPLVVVIITVASKWTAYQNYEYCFILPGYSLYFGLILPIGLILSFNGIIFAMVLYKLSCGRISTSKSSTLESKKENIVKARMEAIRRAQNVVAIGTLMGLTWAFGFLSFGRGRYLFNALFSIFNSLQGVFVFLLFGMRQPELREKLKITKKRFLHGATSARRRSSEFWASSSGARMTQRPSDVTFISTGKTDSVAEGQASTYFESTLDTGPPLNKESNDTLL